ncbi:Clavaminate synthase-like protein [Trametopsis cervina]|nr:Clavaminate synthase-like protein [Trametopsis cervina]
MCLEINKPNVPPSTCEQLLLFTSITGDMFALRLTLPKRYVATVRVSRARRTLATVADAPSFKIPLIDFSKFLNASSDAEKRQTATEVVNGFKEVGFIYLDKHGIPSSTVSNAFQKSAEFFRLPTDTKQGLAWEDPRSNRGYVAIGRERVTQSADADEIAQLRAKAPDFKESMEIGRDWDETWKNQWPQESDTPRFKQTMLDFYETCHQLHVYVMRAIALGLDLEETFFDNKIDQQCHNLRLLSYPPIKTDLLLGDGQARAGAHSDYGTLTLLFQDSVGGLEVQHPHTMEYQPAPPIPNAIVINAGDLLARWSNDVLRSTLHRVVAPPAKKISDTEGITPHRQSIAFFCNPNFDAEISCLPNCSGPDYEPKYPPVTTEQYIVGRLTATYI